MELCIDNRICEKWFTSDGHLICRHGLCEKDFGNHTGVKIVCPLELQRLYEEKKWKIFWQRKDEITNGILKLYMRLRR